MKQKIFLISAILVLTLALIVGCANAAAPETQAADASRKSESLDYGALGALDADDLSIESMMAYAIQDEYLARQEYALIMDEYGDIRPFSNIIRAEEYHIELLTDLYKTYGYDMPEDTSLEHVVLPDSVQSAMDTGVEAEINNIAMYEKFLEADLPDDVEAVFIELKNASENHLRAFQRGGSRNR